MQLDVPDRVAGRAHRRPRARPKAAPTTAPTPVRKRLEVYDASTAPVIDYYRQHGQLTVVDGVGSLDEVFTRILEAIAPVKEVG